MLLFSPFFFFLLPLLLYELRLFGLSSLKELGQLMLMFLLLEVRRLVFGQENLGSPRDAPRESVIQQTPSLV